MRKSTTAGVPWDRNRVPVTAESDNRVPVTAESDRSDGSVEYDRNYYIYKPKIKLDISNIK